MGITRGLVPVSASYDETEPRGGPVDQQKEVGAPLATRLERVSSMMLRIALRDAIELVDVWWACGGVHTVSRQQICELMRQKLAGIVAVYRTHDSRGRVAPRVEEGGESGEKLPDVRRCLMLVAQKVYGLKAGMVIDNNQHVPTSAIDRGKEWTCDVHVEEAPGMRGRIQVAGVRQARGIGFGTGGAGGRSCVSEAARGIRGELRKPLEASIAAVEASMHVLSCIVGRHDLNVRVCAR
eukprot:6195576-Pleurochrysis_carterae.AAC.2